MTYCIIFFIQVDFDALRFAAQEITDQYAYLSLSKKAILVWGDQLTYNELIWKNICKPNMVFPLNYFIQRFLDSCTMLWFFISNKQFFWRLRVSSIKTRFYLRKLYDVLLRLFFRVLFLLSLLLGFFGMNLLFSYLLSESSWLLTLFRFWMKFPSFFLFYLNILFVIFLDNRIVYLPNYCIFWWLSLMECHIYKILFLLFFKLWLLSWLFGHWLTLYLTLHFSITFNCPHIKISSSLPSYLASYIRVVQSKGFFRLR